MNIEQIPYIGKFWAPILEDFNEILEMSAVPYPTLSIPLALVATLLFMWLLLRIARRRRAKAIEEPAEKITKGEAAEVAEGEEAPSFDIEPEVSLDDEPDVDFLVESEEGEPISLEAVEPIEGEPETEEIAELAIEEEPVVEAVEPVEEAAEPEAEPEPELAIEEAEEEEVAEPEPEPEPEPVEEEPKLSFFQRLKLGLSKTKDGFIGRIDELLSGSTEIDDDLFEELEEILVTADIGIQTAYKLLETTQERVDDEDIEDPKKIRDILMEEIANILKIENGEIDPTSKHPFVLMVVGVNGTGKTTTIGKLASMYSKAGHNVLLAAADTFRAAAIEQLEVWGNRVGCDVIKQKPGADPSAVAYDALDAALARGSDMVIIDTAGRLHTKVNLMNELGKVSRVIKKKIPDAPHEAILVLDATTGQNAIVQANEFNKATELTGIILTKLDGTAKGGCIVGIADEFKLPIRFIGIGEKIDDLRPFNADDFVKALFNSQE